ncbi:MAG: ATP-binding protein [bacterium]|nr:ATP-binding protein [bacterium]
MARRFNTAGICRPEKHYMLAPEARLGELRQLIDDEAYFVIHAPRQSGKTTSAQLLAEALTAEGTYAAVLASCKPGAVAGSDVERGVGAVVGSVDQECRNQLPAELRPESPDALRDLAAEIRLKEYLLRWCDSCPRPVVLFLDEIDALVDDTLLSVLDQLHAGYPSRPAHFPHALGHRVCPRVGSRCSPWRNGRSS